MIEVECGVWFSHAGFVKSKMKPLITEGQMEYCTVFSKLFGSKYVPECIRCSQIFNLSRHKKNSSVPT